MHTKDYNHIASDRKLRITALLLGIASAFAILPMASVSSAPKAGDVIIAVGSGQPSQDVASINAAITLTTTPAGWR